MKLFIVLNNTDRDFVTDYWILQNKCLHYIERNAYENNHKKAVPDDMF